MPDQAVRKLKTVLHPNRHFIWALFSLFLFFSALLCYIYISSLKFSNSMVFESGFVHRKTYIDQAKGFSARYPYSWQLQLDQNGNVLFVNPKKYGEEISVEAGKLSDEALIRSVLTVNKETNAHKDGHTVTILQGISRNGSEDIKAAIVKNDNKLFYISGKSDYFEAFSNNFKLY